MGCFCWLNFNSDRYSWFFCLLITKPQLIEGNIQIDVEPTDRVGTNAEEEQIVMDYINSLFSADLESVYDMLYLEKNTPFNTKEFFVEKYKDDIKEITSESMSIVSYDSFSGGIIFSVTYKRKNNPEIQVYEIELSGDKIVDKNFVIGYCTLDIPEGCTLYIEDILIDESYIIPKDDDRALNIYGIPYCIPSVLHMLTYDGTIDRLYAVWELAEDYLTIIYHSNYPNGMKEETYTQTESYYSSRNTTLMKNRFTYKDYAFDGWADAKNPNASSWFFDDGETTDHFHGNEVVHLYAVWDIDSILTIVYHSNFPNDAKEQTHTQRLSVNISEPNVKLMKNIPTFFI